MTGAIGIERLSSLCGAALDDRPVKYLTFVCGKCTVIASFDGHSREEATTKAIAKGWKRRKEQVICPKCP